MVEGYIKKQVAIDAIESKIEENIFENDYEYGLRQAHEGDILLIEDLKPEDVAPVVHGEWIIYVISPFDGEDVKCSICGGCGCAPYWDYCPYCGAKNDKVREEGDE